LPKWIWGTRFGTQIPDKGAFTESSIDCTVFTGSRPTCTREESWCQEVVVRGAIEDVGFEERFSFPLFTTTLMKTEVGGDLLTCCIDTTIKGNQRVIEKEGREKSLRRGTGTYKAVPEGSICKIFDCHCPVVNGEQ
jgi:hypothetical protein